MVTEISHASNEQSRALKINGHSQMDQVTHQNSSVAQQSSAQAEQLKSGIANLVDAIVAFEFAYGHGESHRGSGFQEEG